MKKVRIKELPSKIKIIDQKEEKKKEVKERSLENSVKEVSVNELDFADNIPTGLIDTTIPINDQPRQSRTRGEENTAGNNTTQGIYETARNRQETARNYDSGSKFVLPDTTSTRTERREVIEFRQNNFVNTDRGFNNFVDPRINVRSEPLPEIDNRQYDELHTKRRKELW